MRNACPCRGGGLKGTQNHKNRAQGEEPAVEQICPQPSRVTMEMMSQSPVLPCRSRGVGSPAQGQGHGLSPTQPPPPRVANPRTRPGHLSGGGF